MAARQGSAYWQMQVEGWRQSGLSQIVYCEQHGLNIKSFRRWRTKLQRAATTAASLTLVPISVGAPTPPFGCTAPAAGASSWRPAIPSGLPTCCGSCHDAHRHPSLAGSRTDRHARRH